PDIHINYEEFDTETMKTKVRAALLAGTEPDIWFFNPGEFTTINHRKGKIRGLNDILPVSDYTKEGRTGCSDGDEMGCIPLYLAPSAVYYTKALFAKAGVDPKSWADPGRPTLPEFNAAIDRLLAAGIQPIAMANSAKWPFMFFYWAAQNRYGGTKALSNAIFGQNGASYKDESFVKAGQLVQDLVKRGAFGTGFNEWPNRRFMRNSVKEMQRRSTWARGSFPLLRSKSRPVSNTPYSTSRALRAAPRTASTT